MKLFYGIGILVKKPYRLFFVIAGVTLVIGAALLHGSYATKDYVQTTGEICNVTQRRVLRRQGYVTRFTYDLRWYADGEVFEKHFDDMFDYEPEGEVTIWVSPDNRDAVLGRSDNHYQGINSGYIYLCISLVTGLLAAVMYRIYVKNRRESKKERTDRLENNIIGSIIGFLLSLFGVGYCVFDICKDYRAGEMVSSAVIDLIIACIVAAVICLVIFFVSRKQLNT